MNASRGHRRDYHRALRSLAAQPPRPGRVFPEYIYINWEAFMRASDPFWESKQEDSKRQATSCMYQSRVNTQGQIDTTHRMQEWLEELPDPRSQPLQPSQVQGRTLNSRPRSLSAPAPRPTACPTPGVAKQPPTKRFHHPNPLAQHPVQLGKPQPQPQSQPQPQPLPLPFKVPHRKSSLQQGLRAPQPTPPTATTHQQGDLIQGIQHIQLGEPVQFRGTTQLEDSPDKETATITTQLRNNDIEMADRQLLTSGSRPATASKRHTVQFGEIQEGLRGYLPVEDPQTHGRPESAAVADSQPPNKRQKGRFGSIRQRNRFSVVGSPVFDNVQDGRKSSASAVVRNLGKASKGFFGRLTPSNVTGLPPTSPMRVLTHLALAPILTTIEETHQLRVAFIGDAQCGKTALIHRFTTGAFPGGQQIFSPASNPYTMQLAAPMEVDNYKAVLEVWDISSHLNPIQINPLKLSFFHVIVICFDIKDEANMKSVVDKWQHEPKVFCSGAPVILLGLKSDLRRAYPTLKLRFLEEEDEPTAATAGQGDLTARLIDAAAYFECSARTGEGVVDFFESMVRIAVDGVRARNSTSNKRKFSNFFRKK